MLVIRPDRHAPEPKPIAFLAIRPIGRLKRILLLDQQRRERILLRFDLLLTMSPIDRIIFIECQIVSLISRLQGLLNGRHVVLKGILSVFGWVGLRVYVPTAVVCDGLSFFPVQGLELLDKGYVLVFQKLVLCNDSIIFISGLSNLRFQFLIPELRQPELFLQLRRPSRSSTNFLYEQPYLTIKHLVHKIDITGQLFNFIPDIIFHRFQFLIESLIY